MQCLKACTHTHAMIKTHTYTLLQIMHAHTYGMVDTHTHIHCLKVYTHTHTHFLKGCTHVCNGSDTYTLLESMHTRMQWKRHTYTLFETIHTHALLESTHTNTHMDFLKAYTHTRDLGISLT